MKNICIPPSIEEGIDHRTSKIPAILALENLTNRLAVLCLKTTTQQEQSPRIRLLLEDLADALSCCEEDLGTYDEEGFILDLG